MIVVEDFSCYSLSPSFFVIHSFVNITLSRTSEERRGICILHFQCQTRKGVTESEIEIIQSEKGKVLLLPNDDDGSD